MKGKKSTIAICFLGICLFLSSHNYADFNQNHITKDSVDLTVQKFLDSLTSKDNIQRQAASMYLLGVLDATEGHFWCDYNSFKTTTLRARIYEELKKSPDHELKSRASIKIKEILSRRYPCRRQK